ncbi:hypothetical protein BC829DRAFT_443659 [Chytridium lagenaria]|nr:hypothetical protein BC829DRAFT_443659 [Chytridium lagenaria]
MPWMDHSEGSLPPVTTTTASAPTPTTYITEDTSIEPTTIPLVDSEPVSAEDEQEDDDDFGDFGEISTPPPQETVQPPPAVTVAVEEPKVMYPHLIRSRGSVGKRLTQGGSKFSADLQRYQSGEYIPPLVDYDEDDAGLSNAMPDGSKVKVDMPNEFFAEEDEAEYSSTMSTMFRWKKSQVRKQFLLALGVGPEDLPSELLGDGSSNDAKPAKPSENTAATRTQPSIFGATVVGHPSASVSQQPTAAAASASSSSSDQKAFDVLEAKRLCGLAEDELRNKNNEELEI